MDDASSRDGPEAASVWRHRLYQYLAGVLSADASAAMQYHELQVRWGGMLYFTVRCHEALTSFFISSTWG